MRADVRASNDDDDDDDTRRGLASRRGEHGADCSCAVFSVTMNLTGTAPDEAQQRTGREASRLLAYPQAAAAARETVSRSASRRPDAAMEASAMRNDSAQVGGNPAGAFG